MNKEVEKPHLKVTINSDKFRQPALFFKRNDCFTFAPPGTSEYIKYWTQEREYCMNGYESEDGDRIPGHMYFYLNYYPIDLVNEVEVTINGVTSMRAEKKRDFPRFYDYDRFFFESVEYAEYIGKHMAVLKARRKGYSFKVSAMLTRNYYFYRNSVGFALAAEAEFLVRDGILSKSWDSMDFIDQYTAWYKKRQRTNTKMHRRASFIQKDDTGVEVEMGYKSEIMGVTLKNDPQKARGKAGKLIIYEEAGKFPHLLQAWQISRPSVEQGSHVFGTMIAFGTGGTEDADFESLKELFENPKAYGCLEFENIWDDEMIGQLCGFFIPQYANLEGVYENKEDLNDPYNGLPFMDKDGNTNVKVAKKFILLQRQNVVKNASDKRAIDRHVAEQPITPAEATLDISANIFPKADLQRHLAHVRNDKKLSNYKQVGDLFFDTEGAVKWQPADIYNQRDIIKYRLKPEDDPTGQVVIWEHPKKDPPWGLYIAGCLTPGEKVNTKEGLKNVEDITLSDQLISKDGDFVNINTLLRYEKENEPVHRVKMSNIYRSTNFTQEHPLYVSETPYDSNKTINENKFNFDFVRMRDVKKGMWTKYPNYYKKSLPYSLPFKISDEDYFWWFVGLWLGDGWTSDDKVYACFNKSEMEYVKTFETFVKDVLGRSPWSRVRGNCIEVSFGHRELSNFLSETFGKNALNKKLPEWVKFIPYEYKTNLIQGYLASDGCITKHTKGYYSTEFVSISQELLEGFQDILFSIGIISNMNLMRDSKTTTIQGRVVEQLPTWHLRLSHHSTLDLVKELPFTNDIKINRIDFDNLPEVRKRPKDGCFFSEDKEYIYIQIKDIQDDLYTGTVYNFDCVTHTFVTPYCSTHNCDPYDHDKSGTNSLGSIFIYKRIQDFDEYYELPVAEYTGRPNTANEFYEIVRKLLFYYNATLMYENEKKGLFFYFERMNCTHLLADQPNDLIGDIIKASGVQRKKGIHMNQAIKDWGEGAIRDWLIEEYAPGKNNLTKILSPALLEELISYNDKGNFDRVMSFMTLMIYREQLHKVKVNNKRRANKASMQLFSTELFEDAHIQSENPFHGNMEIKNDYITPGNMPKLFG